MIPIGFWSPVGQASAAVFAETCDFFWETNDARDAGTLFRHTVSYNKPDTILTKSDGAYRPISSQELHRRVGRLPPLWSLKTLRVEVASF